MPQAYEVLRKFALQDEVNFVLYVGNKRLIKRKLFDEFIENINMI